MELIWHSGTDFKIKTTQLINREAIKVEISRKLDYSALCICTDSALWNLLYYSGYLTMDQNNELSIPNKEVLSEWYDWLQLEGKISTTWLFDLLMRGDLTKFNRDLSETIMNTLSYHDVANAKEAVYHLFLAGLFAQAQFSGYEVKSNRESGLGHVDIRIEPKSTAPIRMTAIIEIKRIARNNDDEEYQDEDEESVDELLKKAKEGFEQIVACQYSQNIPAHSE